MSALCTDNLRAAMLIADHAEIAAHEHFAAERELDDGEVGERARQVWAETYRAVLHRALH